MEENVLLGECKTVEWEWEWDESKEERDGQTANRK